MRVFGILPIRTGVCFVERWRDAVLLFFLWQRCYSGERCEVCERRRVFGGALG